MSAALRKATDALDRGDQHAARALVAADVCQVGRAAGTAPVLVGGMCVDLWTASTLAARRPEIVPTLTEDVDIVSAGQFRPGDTSLLRAALARAGYRPRSQMPTKQCRDWRPPGLPFLVQVMDADPWPDDATATIEVDGEELVLWDPETTFWQYAENTISQGFNRDDWIRARAIAAAQPDLDWTRVHKMAGRLAWLVEAARAQRPIEDLLDGPPRGP